MLWAAVRSKIGSAFLSTARVSWLWHYTFLGPWGFRELFLRFPYSAGELVSNAHRVCERTEHPATALLTMIARASRKAVDCGIRGVAVSLLLRLRYRPLRRWW